VPANQQEKEVHYHGSDSGDEGEFPGLSPTELEMLQFSSPLAWMVHQKNRCLTMRRM